jgi:hypothetical protein
MSVSTSIRRMLGQPAFVIAAATLLLAAVSLNGATEFLQLHFKKQRVELRLPLGEIGRDLGPWRQVSTDGPIDHEVEQVLGTQQYVFRDYVDTRRVPAAALAQFNDKTISEQRGLAAQLQKKDPQAVINVAVTYYTGMVDTVAHIPDRCYVADGYEPTHYELQPWDALASRPGDKHVRFIRFEDQTPQRKAVTKNVAYFFHCNGEYVSDPLAVRAHLQNLMERYWYYAKVELMMLTDLPDEAVRTAMNDFLTSALPDIERVLPDWDAVKAAERQHAAHDGAAAAAPAPAPTPK